MVISTKHNIFKRTEIKAEELFLDEVPSVDVEETKDVEEKIIVSKKKNYKMTHQLVNDNNFKNNTSFVGIADKNKNSRIILPGIIFNFNYKNKPIFIKLVDVSPIKLGEMENVSNFDFRKITDGDGKVINNNESNIKIKKVILSEVVPYILKICKGKMLPSSVLVVGGGNDPDMVKYLGIYFNDPNDPVKFIKSK